jgi:dihydrofolate reductase
MRLIAVFAMDLDNAIGKDNKLLCHLPDDLKFFKQQTMGHPVVMGRKTFDSIGKPLPGRLNIVITRNTDFNPPGVTVYHSVEECMAKLKELQDDKICIIGGAEIYRQMMPFTDELLVTLIHHQFEADTFFPEIKLDEFKLVWSEPHKKDDRHPYDFTFQRYERVKHAAA